MMSIHAIEDLSRKAARNAAKKHTKPYLFEEEDRPCLLNGEENLIPFIGNYVPRGWEKVGEYFVDPSGWGSPGEPALTLKQFVSKMKPGFGYATIEAGQFQVHVGEFKKV